jgi:predicted lipoprotein
MASLAQETDQITRAIELYIEGSRHGDAEKLREAFHRYARMWGQPRLRAGGRAENRDDRDG